MHESSKYTNYYKTYNSRHTVNSDSIHFDYSLFIMKIKQIIKFIIFVAIFYAILAFNIFHIGEKLTSQTKDYLDINIPKTDQNLEDIYSDTGILPHTQTWHFAADTEMNMDSLCASIGICDKIHFQGNFSDAEKYWYIKTINKIVQFIVDNGIENKNIKEVINNIEISKENGNRRGYATHNSIIFNIWSVQTKKEFIDLSAHEMGHITDLWYIEWTSPKKDKNFTEFGKAVFAIDDLSIWYYKITRDKETIRKAEVKKKDFCSGYGMTDPFEDFAECFNLYVNHNSFFRQIARTNILLKKKYNIIASVFNGQYIGSNNQELNLVKTNADRRPRDTTKIN